MFLTLIEESRNVISELFYTMNDKKTFVSLYME